MAKNAAGIINQLSPSNKEVILFKIPNLLFLQKDTTIIMLIISNYLSKNKGNNIYKITCTFFIVALVKSVTIMIYYNKNKR